MTKLKNALLAGIALSVAAGSASAIAAEKLVVVTSFPKTLTTPF